MSRVRLTDEHKALLADHYTRTQSLFQEPRRGQEVFGTDAQKTLDDLPYTEEFERLHASFLNRTGLNLSRHDVWLAITNLRKSGRLGRKPRPSSLPSVDMGP